MIVVKDKDIGRPVYYTDGTGERTFGMIKSFNDSWVFVVYNCADDWDNFRNYTAAATDRNDLEFAPESEASNENS